MFSALFVMKNVEIFLRGSYSEARVGWLGGNTMSINTSWIFLGLNLELPFRF